MDQSYFINETVFTQEITLNENYDQNSIIKTYIIKFVMIEFVYFKM